TRMGRTTALMMPSTTPAASAEPRPARLMPGTACAATSSASVYTTTRRTKPMVRARVYTRLAAAELLLAGVTAAAAAQAPARPTGPAMTRGPATAPVTILEWSDFQCPFCQQAQDTMARLLGEFPDSVRLVFQGFPLRSHERSG